MNAAAVPHKTDRRLGMRILRRLSSKRDPPTTGHPKAHTWTKQQSPFVRPQELLSWGEAVTAQVAVGIMLGGLACQSVSRCQSRCTERNMVLSVEGGITAKPLLSALSEEFTVLYTHFETHK